MEGKQNKNNLNLLIDHYIKLQNNNDNRKANSKDLFEETKPDIKLSKYDKRNEDKVLDYRKQVEHGPKKFIKP